jgi:hypothetical protein
MKWNVNYLVMERISRKCVSKLFLFFVSDNLLNLRSIGDLEKKIVRIFDKLEVHHLIVLMLNMANLFIAQN